MATEQEKEELMQTLKFTPRTYRVSVHGRGGEIVIGKISREAYDYWKSKEDSEDGSLDSYVADWDNELSVPDEFRIFEPGEWHDCDDIAHACGASMEDSIITVYDENGDEVWQHSTECASLDESEIPHEGIDEVYLEDLPDGTCAFVGQAVEKGTFFGGDLPLSSPFDPKKLEIAYSDIEGWLLIDGISYDGEGIDNEDYDTVGKGDNYSIHVVGDDDE